MIDGYKRIAALEQLGKDTIDAVIWPMSELEALVLECSMRLGQRDTALEEGWRLQELRDRFGYSLDDLARRFDRSASWVCRRLALVELLPKMIQQKVRMGDISAHVAMKYLVPGARPNIEDCQRMADAFAAHRLTSRQASELYAAWRDASPQIRQRILDDPQLFLKAHQQTEPQAPPLDEHRRHVRKGQDDAHWVEELTDVFYIPAQTLLQCGRTFPDFDRHKLVKDPPGRRFFFTSMATLNHTDPKGRHLSLLRQHVALHPDAFYWIDFSCLPQKPRNPGDEEFFRQTLPKIAQTQSECSTIVIMEGDYASRLWCYVEHYAAVLFSQTYDDQSRINKRERYVEYIGERPEDDLIEKVQNLEEPPWDTLGITDPNHTLSIRHNHTWLCNYMQFQFEERFHDLLTSLPGHDVYAGTHWFQSAFLLDHRRSVARLREMFREYGGSDDHLFSAKSLLWLVHKVILRYGGFSYIDARMIDQLGFSEAFFFSEERVGWLALLLGAIKLLNSDGDEILHLRDQYATIVVMSLFN